MMSENSNMRELKLEDMDKVTGGTGIYTKGGKYYTKSELEEFAHDIAQTMGYDIAGKVICEMTGLATNEAQQAGDMNALLNRLFSILDSGKGGGTDIC